MANETIITVVGNLTADPELRYVPSGSAVANFTIASTPRTFDKQSNEWKDGETMFMRCSIWREAAENVAESLTKGMRVVAQGRLKARSYQDREGNDRTSWEMDVDEVGPSLKYATAKVTRNQGGGGNGGTHRPAPSAWQSSPQGTDWGTPQNQPPQQAPQQSWGTSQSQPPADPWAAVQGQQGEFQQSSGEAPF